MGITILLKSRISVIFPIHRALVIRNPYPASALKNIVIAVLVFFNIETSKVFDEPSGGLSPAVLPGFFRYSIKFFVLERHWEDCPQTLTGCIRKLYKKGFLRLILPFQGKDYCTKFFFWL
jgi:hypothetical protein